MNWFSILCNWLKRNQFLLTSIGALVMILNSTGFDINVPKYFFNLDLEGKMYFLFLINLIVTLFAVSWVWTRFDSNKKLEVIKKK